MAHELPGDWCVANASPQLNSFGGAAPRRRVLVSIKKVPPGDCFGCHRPDISLPPSRDYSQDGRARGGHLAHLPRCRPAMHIAKGARGYHRGTVTLPSRGHIPTSCVTICVVWVFVCVFVFCGARGGSSRKRRRDGEGGSGKIQRQKNIAAENLSLVSLSI